MAGNTEVTNAAAIQWVELPSAWPSARCSFGNISAISTQITAPWPIACAAMNMNIQDGTILKCAVKNAHDTKPNEMMYPKEPMNSRARRPSLSMSHRPKNVNTRLVRPIPTDCSKAACSDSPVILKMRGAKYSTALMPDN